jgi:NAD(P)-dependent dehydrogenase (short-subunit alcohol dehydrogenase family)
MSHISWQTCVAHQSSDLSNAAFQMTHEELTEISDEEWDHTLALNLSAMFHLCKAAIPHMRPGSSIIGTSSVNSDNPTPQLLPYDVTKAGIANFTAGLAGLLAGQGIRANSVAPGPIWTPLIPSTMPAGHVASFGQQVPLSRAGQPAEVGSRLRAAGLGRGQLHLRGQARGHRWQADPMRIQRRAFPRGRASAPTAAARARRFLGCRLAAAAGG